ncbi:MAG: ClpP family protease [Myxococcota bacterium]
MQTRSYALTLLAALLAMSTTACASSRAEARTPEGGETMESLEDGRIVLTSRTVELAGGIGRGMIKKAQRKLLAYDQQSQDPIWLLLNSGGGSVEAGLVLIDTMRGIRSPVYCLVESKAYSMAGIILTFCDRRYALEHATIMLHEASYGTAGEDPSNRSRLAFLTEYLDQLHAEIAGRLGMDTEAYRSKIRDGWWLLPEEALEAQVINGVVKTIDYEDIPVRKLEEKRTLIDKRVEHQVPPGLLGEEIPKRRD